MRKDGLTRSLQWKKGEEQTQQKKKKKKKRKDVNELETFFLLFCASSKQWTTRICDSKARSVFIVRKGPHK